MSRTKRIMMKREITKYDDEPWKRTTINTFGYRRKRSIRKRMRHSIRSKNRSNFSRGVFEPIIEISGEYFD